MTFEDFLESLYTVAVNSKGQKRSVDLNEIYRKARKLGEHFTECEY